MEVKKDDIAKDLRFVASVYNVVMKPFKLQIKAPKKKTIEVKKPKSMVPVKIIYIPRKDESGLRLLVIDSKKRTSRMGVLWIHGGGYVNGFPEMAFITMAKEVSKKCLVVSPSYRLASSYPYPAALEDCYTTLLWMHDHADELGIDKDKIAVGGESAGGGLTVALCLLARDRKEVNVMLQMPIYPMLDCRSDTKSMEDNKPIRINFDNDISVIIKINKNRKISADFLPSSQVAEAYLKENLPILKQRFDDNNIDYEELNHRKQEQQDDRNNRKKGRKDE